MFVLSKAAEVSWVLHATDDETEYTEADFSLIMRKPDKSVEMLVEAFSPTRYTPAEADVMGELSYSFTPDQKGLWILTLVHTNSENENTYHERNVFVSEPDTHVYQQIAV